MNKLQLKGIIESVDLTITAYPIPRNMRERIENILFPRLYEIKNERDTDTSLSDNLEVEISKLNQEDIFYELHSLSIQKRLKEKGYKPKELKYIIYNIQFMKLVS